MNVPSTITGGAGARDPVFGDKSQRWFGFTPVFCKQVLEGDADRHFGVDVELAELMEYLVVRLIKP